jgi:hexulose-6-phosphate isomerase
LEWLLHRCQQAGIRRVVLPFVDASRIDSQKDRDDVIEGMWQIGPLLDRLEIEIHLETALNPEDFCSLLTAINHPRVKVNYDSGNSASLGYDPLVEWKSYGSKVGSVHIKDRVRGGGTVPLGSGDANFENLFSAIAACGYRGPWILQAARGSDGKEVAWARQNRAFLQHWLERIK